mgnify:CR=1 FL=1
MIGSAKRKLKQNSGATILMALMLFLACVTIAGVILGSAMTNLNKVKNQQEQLQVYESVSSAARLVCQRMQGVTYTGSESAKIYKCSEELTNSAQFTYTEIKEKKHNSVYYEYNKPKITVGGDDNFTQLIQEGVEEVYCSKLTYKDLPQFKPSFTQWKKSFEINDSKCEVNVTVTIDENYLLTFKFRPLDGKWKDDYNVTLLVPTISELKPAESHDDTLKCMHSYKKTNNSDNTTEYIENQTFDIYQTTMTTTITYGTGTIYKGASGE